MRDQTAWVASAKREVASVETEEAAEVRRAAPMRPQIQDQEVVVVAEITVRCTAVRAAREL